MLHAYATEKVQAKVNNYYTIPSSIVCGRGHWFTIGLYEEFVGSQYIRTRTIIVFNRVIIWRYIKLNELIEQMSKLIDEEVSSPGEAWKGQVSNQSSFR